MQKCRKCKDKKRVRSAATLATFYSIPAMKTKSLLFILCALLLTACNSTEKQLRQRAGELCRFIPYHETFERSQDCMTPDFYAVLDTMFHFPEQEEVLHEWEFWFVAADGSPVADCQCEVQSIGQTDNLHAVVQIIVTPQEADYELEEHELILECIEGRWLLADFDSRKADAVRYTEIKRQACKP